MQCAGLYLLCTTVFMAVYDNQDLLEINLVVKHTMPIKQVNYSFEDILEIYIDVRNKAFKNHIAQLYNKGFICLNDSVKDYLGIVQEIFYFTELDLKSNEETTGFVHHINKLSNWSEKITKYIRGKHSIYDEKYYAEIKYLRKAHITHVNDEVVKVEKAIDILNNTVKKINDFKSYIIEGSKLMDNIKVVYFALKKLKNVIYNASKRPESPLSPTYENVKKAKIFKNRNVDVTDYLNGALCNVKCYLLRIQQGFKALYARIIKLPYSLNDKYMKYFKITDYNLKYAKNILQVDYDESIEGFISY